MGVLLAVAMPVWATGRIDGLIVAQDIGLTRNEELNPQVRQASWLPEPMLRMDMDLYNREESPTWSEIRDAGGVSTQDDATAPPDTSLPFEFSARLAVAPEFDTADRNSPYFVAPDITHVPERTTRADVELRLRYGGLNAQETLRQQAAQGQSPQQHGITNQFYYDGDIGDGFGWTAGKKVMSWGVGFGFKPLDVIQREDRRRLNQSDLVGIPVLAAQGLTADSSWTLGWANPFSGTGDSDTKDPSVFLQWYRFSGGDDRYAVLRLSQRHRLEAGTGVTRVISDEGSVYGAVLYERRYEKVINSLTESSDLISASNPMTATVRQNGLRAVAGMQWTTDSGWSFLTEFWYDDNAYTKEEWCRLDDLTTRQLTATAVVPAGAAAANVAWSSQAYLPTNLLRENLLTRLSWDDRDGFKPYVELLVAPRDWGEVMTLGAAIDGNQESLSIALRQIGGPEHSVYGQSPVKRMLWLEWRRAIF